MLWQIFKKSTSSTKNMNNYEILFESLPLKILSLNQISNHLGGAQSCFVASSNVPTYVFPRHVTFITNTPEKNSSKTFRPVITIYNIWWRRKPESLFFKWSCTDTLGFKWFVYIQCLIKSKCTTPLTLNRLHAMICDLFKRTQVKFCD